MHTLLVVLLSCLAQSMVASSRDLTGQPKQPQDVPEADGFFDEMRDHMMDMKDFFCQYCMDYCTSGRKPDPPEGSTAEARKPPRLPFQLIYVREPLHCHLCKRLI